MTQLQLTINGESKVFDSPMTALTLLEALQLDARKIALEHNRNIVSPSSFDKTALADGDILEIVHFIGGG